MAMNQVAATRRWWRPTPALLRRLSPLSRDAPRSAHRVRRSFASVASVSPSDRDEVPGWLKSPTDPRLQQFLKIERNYLANHISKPRFRKIERAFYREFRDRVVPESEDASMPERIGSFEYYTRQAPRENYPVFYRRHRVTGVEEVVLDQNEETVLQHSFQYVTAMKVSPDERQLLLVAEDENEQGCAFIKELGSKRGSVLRALPGLERVKNAEWSASTSPRAFYFTRVDGANRPHAVYRHNLPTGAQELIYEESDEAVFVDVSQTKDGKFVLINANSKNTSEIHALDSKSVTARPRLLRPREVGTSYFADHAAGRFFIVTNADKAANYKIVTCGDGEADWQALIPEQADVKIEDVDLFQEYLVLYERVASIPRIRVCKLAEDGSIENVHFVSLPSDHEIGRMTPGVNRDYESHRVRFSVSTPLVPEIVYDYDMKDRLLQVLKQAKVESSSALRESRRSGSSAQEGSVAFNPDDFVCHRSFVPSTGSLGVRVPLTLIHRRGLEMDGKNPTLLMAYGAYGHNLEPEFVLEHLSLLERGWVIALAHVRGGGELGLPWYADGKRLNKRHTFDDYVSCTYHLLDQGFTSPARLAGRGMSAGGLIMGFVANEYPQLFKALIMKVPFVDILTTMQDPTLPLTVHEYDEWGNPSIDPKVEAYIRSYSPCDNVRAGQEYPSMLVTGSLNDQRVQYWEPVKWIWKLRRSQTGAHKDEKHRPLFLLKMSEDDGHFGGGGRLEQLEESAMEIAFLYQALRLPAPK